MQSAPSCALVAIEVYRDLISYEKTDERKCSRGRLLSLPGAHAILAAYNSTNELTEYMAKEIPEAGGIFIKSEGEIAAINVLGASVAGARA